MAAGAFGLSTGLFGPPSGYAETEEVVALARVAARYGGGYHTHMRDEGVRIAEAVREALEIGERAGCPVQISHLKISSLDRWGRAPELLATIGDGPPPGAPGRLRPVPVPRLERRAAPPSAGLGPRGRAARAPRPAPGAGHPRAASLRPPRGDGEGRGLDALLPLGPDPRQRIPDAPGLRRAHAGRDRRAGRPGAGGRPPRSAPGGRRAHGRDLLPHRRGRRPHDHARPARRRRLGRPLHRPARAPRRAGARIRGTSAPSRGSSAATRATRASSRCRRRSAR